MTFTLWGQTVNTTLQRQCAFGCVQLCTGKCRRQQNNMPIVLQFGMQFKSYTIFKDFIANNSTRIAYTAPGLPQSLIVLQICKKTFGQFQIMSLYGLACTACTITLRLSPALCGSHLSATFKVKQQCSKSTDKYRLLQLGRQTCLVSGHSSTVDMLKEMWPFCNVKIDKIQWVENTIS